MLQTIDKPSDQANFGAYVWDNLKMYLGHNIVIGGDFNKNIESLKSIITNLHNHSYNNYLHKLCDTIDLVDIWKLQNPESVRYTRREKQNMDSLNHELTFFLSHPIWNIQQNFLIYFQV